MTTKHYRTLGLVRFGQGDELALDAAQAAVRAGAVEATAGGLYTVQRQVEFKRGEVVGLAGDLPKRLIGLLEPVEAVQPAGRKAPPVKPTPGTTV